MTKINSTVIIMALALFAFVQGAWAENKYVDLRDNSPSHQDVSLGKDDVVTVSAYSTAAYLDGDVTLTAPSGCVFRLWGQVRSGAVNMELTGGGTLSISDEFFGTDEPYVWALADEVSIWVSSGPVNYDVTLEVVNPSEVNSEAMLRKLTYADVGTLKLSGNITLTSEISVENGESLEIDLNGKKISRNLSAAKADGHVFNVKAGGSLVIKDSHGGGEITGGWATNGGGIYNMGTVSLQNVSVTGNKATNGGGGVWNGGTLNVQGVVQIKDNQSGAVNNNLFLADGKYITLTGALQEGSQIGVSTEKISAKVTSGYSEHPFVSDFIKADADRVIVKESDEVYSYSYYIERFTDGNSVKRPLKPGEYQDFSVPESGVLASGVYYVGPICTQLMGTISCSSNNISVSKRITISSGSDVTPGNDIKLVLADGVQLTLEKGINVAPSTDGKTGSAGKLHIYGQKDGTGKLIANGESDQAGIGGNDKQGNGLIEIHGGYVQSTGGKYGAGIGTGDEPVSWRSAIYIYGGTVVAQGGTDAAGIGGGNEGKSPKVFIYDGTVNATGGKFGAGIGGGDDSGIYGVSIYGGTVTAQGGDYGAGIGTGDEAGANTSDPILIKGGTVTATGGTKGAGIGGGNESESPAVTIDGGVVTANGTGDQETGGAGIGGGDEYPQGGKITINGGTVTAKGGGIAAAGIGGGGAGTASGAGLCGNTNKGGEVQITGGNVTVIANRSGAGIGGGYKAVRGAVTITGGNHYIEGLMGSAIGGGYGFTYHFSDCEPDIVFGPKIIVSSAKYNGESQQFENSYTNATSSDRNDTCHANKRRVWIRSCDHQDGIFYTLSFSSPKEKHTAACRWCGYTHTDDHLQTSDGTCYYCGYKAGSGWWTITLNEASVSYSVTEAYVTRGAKYVLPEPSSTPVGYAFVGWYLGPMDHLVAGGYMVDPKKIPEGVGAYLRQSGEEIEVTGDINLVACYAQTDFGAVYIDPHRMSAIINGNYKGTGVVDIQEEYVVGEVYFDREFVKDVPSTITLPFETTIGQVEGANFYDITNLVIEDGVWHVKTHRLGKNGENNNTIVANKPYLLKPTANGQIIFHADKDGFTLNTTEKRSYTVDGDPSISGDKWSFRGAYNYIVLGDSTGILGRAYGFSAETDGDIPVGMFVRGGADADIPALRAYLVHEKAPSPIKASFLNNTQLTSASKVNYSLEMPSETVVIDFDDEERTTVIGTLNPVTGQIRINSAERWFDVQGRLLKGKPTAKGRYFHNGRVEIIK